MQIHQIKMKYPPFPGKWNKFFNTTFLTYNFHRSWSSPKKLVSKYLTIFQGSVPASKLWLGAQGHTVFKEIFFFLGSFCCSLLVPKLKHSILLDLLLYMYMRNLEACIFFWSRKAVVNKEVAWWRRKLMVLKLVWVLLS